MKKNNNNNPEKKWHRENMLHEWESIEKGESAPTHTHTHGTRRAEKKTKAWGNFHKERLTRLDSSKHDNKTQWARQWEKMVTATQIASRFENEMVEKAMAESLVAGVENWFLITKYIWRLAHCIISFSPVVMLGIILEIKAQMQNMQV